MTKKISESEEIEKKESGKLSETTRRDFLKSTSTAIILASGLLSIDAADACTRNKASIPRAMKFLVFDPALCTGCGTCEMVCSTLWNNGKASPALSRITVSRDPFGTSDDNYSPNPCLQCVDAPCLKACPIGAIKVDKKSGTNARVIDEKLCKGLKKCIESCPYEEKRITFDVERNKAAKCHLCRGDPQCVKWCPNGALRFSGPPDFAPVIDYMSEVTKKPMVEKSYMIVLKEDREKELGYPREEK
jgi:Fe-S-cluster-containing dehydrogenase component